MYATCHPHPIFRFCVTIYKMLIFLKMKTCQLVASHPCWRRWRITTCRLSAVVLRTLRAVSSSRHTETRNAVVMRNLLNPLNAELNPICHLLALLEGATVVDGSGLRVNNDFQNTVLMYMKMDKGLIYICHKVFFYIVCWRQTT